MPIEFTIIEAKSVRYTRRTQNIASLNVMLNRIVIALEMVSYIGL